MTDSSRASRGSWFRAPDETGEERRHNLDKLLLPHEREALGSWHWEVWGRDEQLPPPGDWRVWLICAGRGFGKTRAGAEWVRNLARHDGKARIALVGASFGEVRSVMVEGESGVLNAARGSLIPDYEPSLRRLQWANGAQAFLYSAAEPDSLRGPQHSHAWCDEIAKWDNAGGRALAAWDNLQLGLRLGEKPRLLATSTPRRVALMARLYGEARSGAVVVATGRTADNAGALPTRFYAAMLDQFDGSSLGRQELDGEMLAEAEGALWTRALLEASRDAGFADPLLRVVVGVDPLPPARRISLSSQAPAPTGRPSRARAARSVLRSRWSIAATIQPQVPPSPRASSSASPRSPRSRTGFAWSSPNSCAAAPNAARAACAPCCSNIASW